jgi:hypothetical protein
MTKRNPRSTVATSFSPHHRSVQSYLLCETDLEMGASLGNSAIWVNTKSTGAIERIFSLECGRRLVDSVILRYGGLGSSLQAEPDQLVHTTRDARYIGLDFDGPADVEIHPAYQRRRFSIGGAIAVTETIFVPLGERLDDDPVAYIVVDVHCTDTAPHELRVVCFARLRGTSNEDVEARFDSSIHALVARNRGEQSAVRIFGLDVEPTRYGTTFDYGSVSDRSHIHALSNDTSACGDILGAMQLDISLRPDESKSFSVVTGVYAHGESAAVGAHAKIAGWAPALAATSVYMEELLGRARVLTPDRVINQGAMWSKVNMRRVMGAYPQGRAFTNEPGMSSNVVMRDAAWFVYGCDHFLPEFSRGLLDKFAALQYPDGKIAEYYSAVEGGVEDYGLNINDDTPLFILAVNHHFRATGDLAWLKAIYAAVVKAAHCIQAQTDERGLVICRAHDARGNVWGIAGWRNVIPGYSINGAVTEINAECAAALRAAGHLARNLRRPAAEADELFAAGERIRTAMDEHLRNPENGLYYLNIDVDGNVHTDVTGDQIFPVMLRVSDQETGYRIISRLNSPDFMTEAGLRTASRNDPLYDPSANVGLIGGVWPGLTWWYAFAAAKYHPEFMVKALRSSFDHYAASPKANNTVPGQFGEWFDGESLINRGMRLSPWEPPRFLWAAIEGVCGLMLSTGNPRVNPLVPQRWRWTAVRRVQYHGEEISFFVIRQDGKFRIYVTGDVDTDHHHERFEEDVSDRVDVFSEAAVVVAFKRADASVVLVGNVSDQTITAPVNLANILAADNTYSARMYDGERDEWEELAAGTGATLSSIAIIVESYGYRLLELKQIGS